MGVPGSSQPCSSPFPCEYHCLSSLSVPGLDYVSHEDILPYTSTDQVPIQHELFERFLLYDQTKGDLPQGGKLGREGPFFRDSVIEVTSKPYTRNLI